MYSKLSSPITIIILILLSSLFIPRHYARNDTKLYQDCSTMSHSPCGKPISGKLDYPFWIEGVTQSDCGLEEFKLSCDHDDLVLNMGSYNKYRVAAIYPLKGLLTLYHYDILESICESIDSHVPVTKFNDTLYDHSPNTGFLDLYYDCRDAIDTTGNMSDLTCSNGVTDRVYSYQKNPVTPVELEMLKSCSHTVLPVNLSVLEDFIKDSTEQQLQKLFQGSIEVSYSKSINLSACSECAETGGLCYRGTHLYTNDPCLYQQSAGPKHRSALFIGIACGVFGGTILLLSVLIIYCCRKKAIHGVEKSLVSNPIKKRSVDNKSENIARKDSHSSSSFSPLATSPGEILATINKSRIKENHVGCNNNERGLSRSLLRSLAVSLQSVRNNGKTTDTVANLNGRVPFHNISNFVPLTTGASNANSINSFRLSDVEKVVTKQNKGLQENHVATTKNVIPKNVITVPAKNVTDNFGTNQSPHTGKVVSPKVVSIRKKKIVKLTSLHLTFSSLQNYLRFQ